MDRETFDKMVKNTLKDIEQVRQDVKIMKRDIKVILFCMTVTATAYVIRAIIEAICCIKML